MIFSITATSQFESLRKVNPELLFEIRNLLQSWKKISCAMPFLTTQIALQQQFNKNHQSLSQQMEQNLVTNQEEGGQPLHVHVKYW